MKVRLSELRRIIREELAFQQVISETSDQDKASYDSIMSMIMSALGDNPAAKKIGADLGNAMGVPQQISMKSIAQKAPKPAPTGETISMQSIAQKPEQEKQSQEQPQKPGKAGSVTKGFAT